MKQYGRNYMGANLSDEEMRDIPYPGTELISHVTFKTFQAGCILGTLLGTAKAVKNPATRNAIGIEQTIARFGRNGILIGLVLGPTMTVMMMKAKNMDHDGLFDRAYRLRYNRNQVRVDRGSELGACTGIVYSVATRGPIWSGVAAGATLGVLAAAAYNSTTEQGK